MKDQKTIVKGCNDCLFYERHYDYETGGWSTHVCTMRCPSVHFVPVGWVFNARDEIMDRCPLRKGRLILELSATHKVYEVVSDPKTPVKEPRKVKKKVRK